MAIPTDKERIAKLEQQLAATNKDLEAAKQKVTSFEQSQEQSTDRKLFVAEKVTKHFILGPKLKESLVKLLSGDASKDNIADVLTAALYRFTRIGIFALLVAIVPIGILTIQTILLSRQNDKIDRQNFRLDQQTALLEADRRSAVILESGNVLDAISRELADDGNNKDSLSFSLIGRTIALSRAFKPYKYLDPESDTIIGKSISPERGHLLVSLHESKLDSITLRRIILGGSFEKADLSEANLRDANLRDANLRDADLRDANLLDADLRGAYLTDADLRGAHLSNADLRAAHLIGADFRGEANLYGADLRYAYLNWANLSDANLSDANLSDSYLTDADLTNTNFIGADFIRANLVKVNLTRAYLYDANLYDADLSRADLRDANLIGANLSNADLTDAINYTIEQLLSVRSLNETKGIPEEMRALLLAEKECLFTEEGCPLGDDNE